MTGILVKIYQACKEAENSKHNEDTNQLLKKTKTVTDDCISRNKS